MATKRQLELYLLRLLPHVLRDDFITIGFLLKESDGGFADLRLTRDWKLLQCFAPEIELEWFQVVENEIRRSMGQVRGRDELLSLLSARFGAMMDVGPTKAVVTEDPVKEMDVLASMYLEGLGRAERRASASGRTAIVNAMKDAFAGVGVLELLQREMDLTNYTGMGDPFRIDFGYRVGNEVKMFHGASMATSVEPALALAYRYSRVDAGMQREGLRASLTAVIDRPVDETKQEFAIRVLEESLIRVRTAGEIPAIAKEVQRELGV